MIVQRRHFDGATLLKVEGVVKLGESAAFFVEALEKTLSSDDGHVMIDLSGIREMDSTGLGELVDYLGRFKKRERKLILIDPSPQIRRLLEISQLQPLFPTFDSLESALAG